ncbi:MAG: hypothetical protein N4A33_05630 [Bacteriovoracaceae bacterium]|nr:hypothetical protein [Bacteriovoracaceae bacterium]
MKKIITIFLTISSFSTFADKCFIKLNLKGENLSYIKESDLDELKSYITKKLKKKKDIQVTKTNNHNIELNIEMIEGEDSSSPIKYPLLQITYNTNEANGLYLDHKIDGNGISSKIAKKAFSKRSFKKVLRKTLEKLSCHHFDI